jgi:hypothetical protein
MQELSSIVFEGPLYLIWGAAPVTSNSTGNKTLFCVRYGVHVCTSALLCILPSEVRTSSGAACLEVLRCDLVPSDSNKGTAQYDELTATYTHLSSRAHS